MDATLAAIIDEIRDEGLQILVLTGAGISAESGIPTFRGPEGYWTVGSAVYRPEEMATRRFFDESPAEVWAWYLYRLGVCREARPNAAHEALVRLEAGRPDRFQLITQNVDGLHRRAGTGESHLYEIHGRADRLRCAEGCGAPMRDLPVGLAVGPRASGLDAEELALLRCEICSGWLRPHVLWFDEYYDEENYHADSAMAAAADCGLLVTVGTSAATNLPNQIFNLARRLGSAIIDVNVDDNPFAQAARATRRGFAWRERASIALPRLVDRLLARG